jgi:hypothetical protein
MSKSRIASAITRGAGKSKTQTNKRNFEALESMLERVESGKPLTEKQLERYMLTREAAKGMIGGSRKSPGADISMTTKEFNTKYPTVKELQDNIRKNVETRLKERRRKSPNEDPRNQEGDPLDMENLSEDEFAEMMGLVNPKSAAAKERGSNMYNKLNYNKGGVKRKAPAAKKKMMRGGAVKGKPRTGHSDYRKGGLFK